MWVCASYIHVWRVISSFPYVRQDCFPVFSMEGNLVNNQVAPPLLLTIYMEHLGFFSLILIHTHIYTVEKPPLPLSISRSREFLIEQNTTESLPIFDFKTCFRFLETRAFIWSEPFYDPWSFFVRVFRTSWTSRLVLFVILASIICETDTIILRISRSTTYFNFIEIWNSWI